MKYCINFIIAISIVLLGVFAGNVAQASVADVVFTLDVSGSIDDGELGLEIDGLKSCLDLIPQNGNVGVGVVVYANGSDVAFSLQDINGSSDLSR